MIDEKIKEFGYKRQTLIYDIPLDGFRIHRIRIPLNMVFAISLGSQDFYEGTVIEILSGSTVGYGEAETIQQITGENPEVLYETVYGILSLMDGMKFQSVEEFSLFINSYCHGNSAAKSCVDIAVHDLIAKSYSIHITRLLGGSMEPRRTALTIPIGSVTGNISLLEKYIKMGAKIIKVKVGKDLDTDIERINAIAEHLGRGIKFFADANQGFNLSRAIKMANVLEKNGALFFEQPMPGNDMFALRDLRTKSSLPVMLDESIFTPADVINAIRIGAADMVNVKLSKSGGIRNAIKALSIAQAAGIEAMVGCMLESKLGIAASLAVANSVGNVKYTDLDGYTYLSEQPFDGGVEFKDGMNYPINGSGLAVKMRNVTGK